MVASQAAATINLRTLLLAQGSQQRKKVTKLRTFYVWGGGAQPHSIAFGGVFPNITEAIWLMKLAQKSEFTPQK